MSRVRVGRASLGLIGIIGLLIVVLVALVIAGGAGKPPFKPLDPDDPSAKGARAVAEVLRARGVAVTAVRSPQALADTASADTVLVTDPNNLSSATMQSLERKVKGRGRLVLLEPTHQALTTWKLPLDTSGQAAALGPASCPAPQLTPTMTMKGGSILYAAVSTEFADKPTYRCFPSEGKETGGHGVVIVPSFDMDVVAVGNAEPWLNSTVLTADHAALALRLTGQGAQSVLWYVPPTLDVSKDGERRSPGMIPPFVMGLLMGGTVLVIAVAFWRGRRFGRLIREPLPVLVAASETTEARGRLYRSTRDAPAAAARLRAATQRRLARRLGLPVTAPLEDLLARAPQHADALRTHLAGGPITPKQLADLVTHLRRLEREIGRP